MLKEQHVKPLLLSHLFFILGLFEIAMESLTNKITEESFPIYFLSLYSLILAVFFIGLAIQRHKPTNNMCRI
jgi:NhaP-type Na+/H+ or K+/H+ antiporter